ncbi:MAG: phosphoesterase, partial [Lachnospiraceae bacterium]|nr:phosphoesterase [Lachnospiraceae bacterium]
VHGGQFVVPGKGGFVSPEFEFFPELYEGVHTYKDTTMIISRGLGNSVIPLRVNNYPELVVIKLAK